MKILAGALLLLLVASSRCAEVRRLSAEELQRSDLWKDDSQRLLLFPEQGWRKLFDLLQRFAAVRWELDLLSSIR